MLDDVFGSLEHVPGDSRGLQLDREPAAREPEPRTQLELPRRSPPSSSSKALVALEPCLDFVLQGRDRIYTSSIMTFQSEFWSWMSPSAVKLGTVPVVEALRLSLYVSLMIKKCTILIHCSRGEDLSQSARHGPSASRYSFRSCVPQRTGRYRQVARSTP
jgi:hypothetical protein